MKIAIFYLLCGGGHLSASQAVATQCQKTHPQVEVKIFEAKSASRFVGWLIGRGYALAINRLPFVWKFLFWLYTRPWMVRATAFVFGRFFRRYIENVLSAGNFDRVVSTHFFLTKVLTASVRKFNLPVRVFCLVTDPFTVPPYWFLDKNVDYLVFSESAKQIGVTAGIPREKIKIFSPLLNPNFESNIADASVARANLGLSSTDKVVLIVGGGDGLPNGAKIVRALGRMVCFCDRPYCDRVYPREAGRAIPIKIIVVCGRDKNFYNQVKKLQTQFSQIVQVFGFVDLAKIMPTTDVVVGKAGPAVVFESLLLGKPIVLSSYVWKQEKGNMEYVVENKVGFYEPNLHRLTARVKEILFVDDTRIRLDENIKKLNIKNGASAVARYIIEGKLGVPNGI